MQQPKIIAYLKPMCGWSNGVRAIMRKYNLQYEDRDVINNPDQYEEMVRKSGQPLSPCVEVDGHMLADISGEEVEAWMTQKGYLQKSDRPADAPTNSACPTDSPIHLK
jgi:monothiol glutaredoxin